MYALATSFLLLSGIASLTYQVAWVRLLGLSMGSTSASVSTVLAAFFLGMASGSYLAERITRNRIDNFTPYIILEILIGISGLALLPILLNLDQLMALMPAFGTQMGLKFLLAVLLLAIPTICMGATFPVMASILIRRQDEVGLRMGQLYSLNTAGAVLGAALSGFIFIPNWGLDGAIFIAFGLNISIVIIAAYFNRRWTLPPLDMAESGSEAAGSVDDTPFRHRALIVLFVTGFVAIATQVGWTKYLAIFTGTTIYGFAAILTVFLTGIALGAWVIKSHLQQMRSPQTWMAAGLVLLALSLILTRVGLSWVPSLYGAINHLQVPSFLLLAVKYSLVFVLLFIPTFLFGALFPLNLKLYCGNLSGVRARIGKAYAVNTVASIFGAILAGFWVIPQFGTDALLTVLALIIVVLPLLFLRATDVLPRVAIAALAGITVLGAWQLPQLNYQDMIASAGYDKWWGKGKAPQFLYLEEGKAGVISMVTFDGTNTMLQNNGLTESVINLKDPNQTLLAESLLGVLPYMLHENPKTAFMVGFGGGITTRALTLTDLESIRVVELEPTVVAAGRAIRGGEIPFLKDPRVELSFNDARNILLVEDTSYDIIVSQPSHPWVARASNVFTQQFWQMAKSRLNQGGVFGQWINLFNMDAQTLRSLFKAFYSVFPHGMSFANIHTGNLLLFGSEQPLVLDYQRINATLTQPQIKAVFKHRGIADVNSLLLYFSLSREEALIAAGDAVPNTDTNIISEVRLSALTGKPVGEDDPYGFLIQSFHLDLTSFLGEQAAARLYSLVDYYFRQNELILAEIAARQLEKLDPILSRAVDYQLEWQRHDYPAAFELYQQHGEWPARTHLQQALALMDLGRSTEAWRTIEAIEDRIDNRAAMARLIYEQKQWSRLAALEPESDEERQWQLLGYAKQGLAEAGAELAQIVSEDDAAIPQLRMLLQYYAATDQKAKLDKLAGRLTQAIDQRVSHLKQYAEHAIENRQADRALLLVRKIAALNPQAESLDNLRTRAASLNVRQAQQQILRTSMPM